MRLLIAIGLSFGQLIVHSQEFAIRGQLTNCYFDMYDGDKLTQDLRATILVTDQSNGNLKEFKTDSLGNFALNLNEGTWRIHPSGQFQFLYNTPDTLIRVDKDLELEICIDTNFRPLEKDKTAEIVERAKKDIEKGEIKLYKFTPWSIDYENDPLNKTNKKAKQYGVKCILISCMRLDSRESVKSFFDFSIYNDEIAKFLDTKYGPGWRKRLEYKAGI